MIIPYLWMKKILKAILFDLDDTLYLERDFVKSGFKTVATLIQNDNGIDKEVVYNRFWSIFNSGERKKIFDSYISEFGKINYTINELVNIYRSHVPNINLLPGIDEYLLLSLIHI